MGLKATEWGGVRRASAPAVRAAEAQIRVPEPQWVQRAPGLEGSRAWVSKPKESEGFRRGGCPSLAQSGTI